MNSQTSLSVRPSEGNTDQVRLISGEASFATITDRSLTVWAAEGRTIAQDARFNIRHLNAGAGSSVWVTCLAGNVRVEQRSGHVVVSSGQQLRYDADRLGAVATVDPVVATAWQQGILVFRFTPLVEVVDEINRYRPGRVILLNDELGRSPVSGRFRIDHMDEIFGRLATAFGAQIRSFPWRARILELRRPGRRIKHRCEILDVDRAGLLSCSSLQGRSPVDTRFAGRPAT